MKTFVEWSGFGGVVSRAPHSLRDSSVLRQILGDEEYDRIMGKEAVADESESETAMLSEDLMSTTIDGKIAIKRDSTKITASLRMPSLSVTVVETVPATGDEGKDATNAAIAVAKKAFPGAGISGKPTISNGSIAVKFESGGKQVQFVD